MPSSSKFVMFWKTEPKNVVQKGCFSQWWKSSFSIDGIEYNCAEQWMMAEKARLFGDEEVRQQILASKVPAEIKALGRKVRNFDPAIWEQHKLDIVVKGNYAKFSQDESLKSFLLSTGDKVLVEASPLDKIWGIGLAEDDPLAQDQSTWKGQNLLGKALMKVRDMLSGKAE